ncbi:AmmeMemoRadiSam system protein A [bacterium]|nr:AmmeMemoRadiSam system protein A [bacterium]MBU1991026.1 AmmeMemoRadiSam system protein A [bacterium]
MLDPILLRIAKNAILSRFYKSSIINRGKLFGEYPFLNTMGACFVTLHTNHDLRGCIGSIVAHTSLLEDLIQNSVSAAFNDPRFAPLESSELSSLRIEVSVLSKPELLEYADFDELLKKVRPSVDGLILKYGGYQGTFLPQVWEQLPHAEDFLEHLSVKAGADPSIYARNPSIYRYTVDAIEEDFDAILPL